MLNVLFTIPCSSCGNLLQLWHPASIAAFYAFSALTFLSDFSQDISPRLTIWLSPFGAKMGAMRLPRRTDLGIFSWVRSWSSRKGTKASEAFWVLLAGVTSYYTGQVSLSYGLQLRLFKHIRISRVRLCQFVTLLLVLFVLPPLASHF